MVVLNPSVLDCGHNFNSFDRYRLGGGGGGGGGEGGGRGANANIRLIPSWGRFRGLCDL